DDGSDVRIAVQAECARMPGRIPGCHQERIRVPLGKGAEGQHDQILPLAILELAAAEDREALLDRAELWSCMEQGRVDALNARRPVGGAVRAQDFLVPLGAANDKVESSG